jgi:phenol hydroxylase P0 protein
MRTPNAPLTSTLGAPPAAFEPLICDTSRKFVRVTEVRADGLVAFEFSIGWPELAVELLLPRGAFDEFCTTHQVTTLAPRADDPHPADNEEETDE